MELTDQQIVDSIPLRYLGPHHRDLCLGKDYEFSGDGYNRVRICSCGAEDPAPTLESARRFRDLISKTLEEHQNGTN